jgi:hypothetical protein
MVISRVFGRVAYSIYSEDIVHYFDDMDHEVVPHYNEIIRGVKLGTKEICEIINGVLARYPLLSPACKRELEEWISECCQDLNRQKV